VGSNAVRLVVARAIGQGARVSTAEASYRVPLRLGADVFTSGRLPAPKIEQLVTIFHAFRHLIGFFRPHKLRACATSALREADNGAEAADRVERNRHSARDRIRGGGSTHESSPPTSSRGCRQTRTTSTSTSAAAPPS
jgi:exopolyphosphatase/pppGpp-phosphohydrolase